MRQNSNETAGNMISMEEYLKKRQAMTPPAARWQTERNRRTGNGIETGGTFICLNGRFSDHHCDLFKRRVISINAYNRTGISIVAATEALNSPDAAGESMSAKIRVAAYMQMRRTAPVSARICFIFFIALLLTEIFNK